MFFAWWCGVDLGDGRLLAVKLGGSFFEPGVVVLVAGSEKMVDVSKAWGGVCLGGDAHET